MRGLDSSIHDLSISNSPGPRPPSLPSSAISVVAHDSTQRPARPGRRPLRHPAVLLASAAGILFIAYALGYLPQFGSLFEAAVRSTRNAGSTALDPALYGIGGLAAFLVLFALLRTFDLFLRKFRKPSPLALRPLKPINSFLEEAATGRISVRVARESYHLLKPHYPQVMSIDLRDDLRSDLGLSNDEIELLATHLLTRCDRREAPAMLEARNVTTVFDLLYKVETATVLRGGRLSQSRVRSTDAPGEASEAPSGVIPTFPSRNPTSAERKAIHAAALRTIESRSLRSTGTPALHHRHLDYDDSRRRGTEADATPPVFKGPFRRATDRTATRTGNTSPAQQSETKPDGLVRPNPMLVPPAV